MNIIHTPGHSPGSISIYWPTQKALITGDLIFKNGIGRTDLPGGNGAVLKESIKLLQKLDVKYLLPGHGEIITDTGEVQKNFDDVERAWFDYI